MNNTWILKLYPEHWRARYEPEFRALLEEAPVSLMDLFDITFGALDAHLRPQQVQPSGGAPIQPPVEPDPTAGARKRVRHLKYHFIHLAIFAFFSLLFITVNLLTSRGFYWAPIAIWALAMPFSLHTMLVHKWRGLFGAVLVPLTVMNIGLIGINIFISPSYPWSIWTLSVTAIPVTGMALVSFGITTPQRALAISGGLVVALLAIGSVFDPSLVPTALFNVGFVISILLTVQQMRRGLWSLFQAHIFLFLAINALAFLLNILSEPDTLWFQYVLAASVLVLAVHAMVRYGLVEFYDSSWEQAKIAQLTTRIKESAITDSVQRNIFLTARIQHTFWTHLFFSVVLALDLTVINLLSGTDTPWLLWPVGAWAVAILTHAGYAFGPNRLLSANLMFWMGASLGLIAINEFAGNSAWWFWPVTGYGIVVLAHTGWVFVKPRWYGALLLAAIAGIALMVIADLQTSSARWWHWPTIGIVLTVLLATPFALNLHHKIANWESRKVSELTGK